LPPQTSKERTGRIPLDYFKRVDPLHRLRGWLSAAAALASLLWLVGLGWDAGEWPGRAAERVRGLASHGPLARAHATWEAECESCHTPFRPINATAGSLGSSGPARCRTCHADVADHHARAAGADVPSCAGCHPDHRGREASLITRADRDCTGCHADLRGHTRPGAEPGFAASVTRFDGDRAHHPEFALFRGGAPKDPGRIKFNHALHLTEGLPKEPGGRVLMTLADLPADERPRYRNRGSRDSDPVQLRCDSCHRPEGVRGAGPGRDRGPLMSTARYATECKACHPLTFDLDLPAARHPLQPAEVDESLWQAYSSRYVRDHPELQDVRPSPRPVPGAEVLPEVRTARRAVAEQAARAERVLSGEGRCGKCHDYEAADGRPLPVSAGWGPGPWPRVTPARVNDVWFRHAAFDHAPHSSVGCRACHARAYPDAPDASRASGDLMLPGIAVCQACHAPRGARGGSVTGGAGFHCTECHRYHGGDDRAVPAPLPARDAALEDGLQRFLLGVRGPRS
jgi:hypothetical protein